MKNILITGGFGYVGSQLIELLSKRDDITFTVLDNLMCGNELNVPFIHGDIRDKQLLLNIMPVYDTIVHLAAIVGQPACAIDPAFAFSVNVQGTKNILAAMCPWQRIIFASSSSVYGDKANQRVYEDSSPEPINDYSIHKVQAEWLVRDSKFPYIILRPVTAFGTAPFTRTDVLVNTLIQEALTTGQIKLYEPNVIRPIIHVYDYARILEWAIDGHLGTYEIYNIGDPDLTMLKGDLAREIALLTGAEIIQSDDISPDLRNYDVVFNKLLSRGYVFVENALDKALYQLENNKTVFYSVPERVKQYIGERGNALYNTNNM